MPHIERTDDEITKALEFWMKNIEDTDEKSFYYEGEYYSPREIVREVKQGTPMGKDLVATAKSLAEKLNMDPTALILMRIVSSS